VCCGDTDAVLRFPYRSGDLVARGAAETVVLHLPAGGHATRDVAFSPDGATMYVSVGSASNVAEGMGRLSDADLRKWIADHPLGATWGDEAGPADVLAFDPHGKNQMPSHSADKATANGNTRRMRQFGRSLDEGSRRRRAKLDRFTGRGNFAVLSQMTRPQTSCT